MNFLDGSHIERFVVIGTNFTKADTATRSRFAVTKSMSAEIYKNAIANGFKDFVVLSTCNRSEFYGCCEASELKFLVTDLLKLSEDEFATYFYILSGMEAVRHFFRVVSGLDSQIVGDYEIVCQVKAALDESRKYDLVGTIIDRVSNFSFQSSKKIKAHTNLSSGKYSVSYAAAEMIAHKHDAHVDRILVVGTGDFGSTVARNLRHYFPKVQLGVTNRTREKAEILASHVRAEVIPFENFSEHLNSFDAVITTVGLDSYLIHQEDVQPGGHKLFLDLSVPQAVDPEVKQVEGVRVYSVDEVSAFHNELLQQRHHEIPRAEKIVEVFIDRFMEWHQIYHHRDIILGYKQKIQNLIYDHQLTHQEVIALDHSKKIQKTFSDLIQQIKTQGYAGCMLIEAMNNLVPAEK